MKKVLFSMMAMLLMMGSVSARPVSVDKARQVAETWMRAQGMKNVAALQDITSQTPFTEFYVFAATEGGFILVSADDCVMPVLGYSTTSKFDTKRELPRNVLGWLSGCERTIRRLKQVNATRLLPENAAVANQWQMMAGGVVPPMPLTTAVSPLLTTTWNQLPYYNNLCPSSGGEQAVTGCVATATAQVMKYHNHPTTGWGSHTYDSYSVYNGVTYYYPNLTANFGSTTYQWSQMPNALTASSTTAQVNAVATLMYHIGVADEMKYSPEFSGSNNIFTGGITSSSQHSLMKYFKYRADMGVVSREDYGYDVYCTLLRNELDASRPLLYQGTDETGGHSFVLDGYDNSSNFHVNWGWGGSYDGYYPIGGLIPEGGGTGANMGSYDMENSVIIGLQPHTSWSSTGTTTINAAVQSGSPAGATATVYGAGSANFMIEGNTYSYGDSVMILAEAPQGYRFESWSDGDKTNPRYLIANGGTYTFTASYTQMSTDTVTYCNTNATISAYDMSTIGTWGVKYPASILDAGKYLSKIQFYVYEAGTYNITVYTGANHSVVAANTTYIVPSSGIQQWHTVTFNTPVAATEDVWITFSAPTLSYPAAFTNYSGNPESNLLGPDLEEYGDIWLSSFAIKGIFRDSSSMDCTVSTFPYSEGFEDINTLGCWHLLDSDGDGYGWGYYGVTDSAWGHNSDFVLTSASWMSSAGVLTPDNWLFMPALELPAGQQMHLKWYTKGQDSNYAAENYSIMISTVGGSSASDITNYTSIFTGTTTASWEQKDVDLSAYAGQTVYIAFRHHNSSDMFRIVIDDVEVAASSTTPDTVSSNCDITSLPWNYGFEADQHCWTLREADNSSYGFYIENQFAHSGSNCLAGPYNDYFNVDQWAISPAITLPANVYDIQLSYYVYTNVYAGIPNSYQVRLSTTDTAISSFSQLLESVTDSTRSYVQHTLSLGAYAGQTIRLAFRNISDMGGNTMAFDDIHIGVLDAPTQYTLTVLSNNSSWGTVSGGGIYAEGSTATLTATANSGYHFVAWNDGNTANPRTITVTDNATYTATFAVNAAPGNCDVTTLPWNYSFITDSISDCWTNVDADGDGLTWMYFQNFGAVSFSYIQSGGNAYSLTPDDWLISPRVTLPASGAEFHYTYLNIAPNYPDHIGVFVSTTDTARSSFMLLEEYTAVAADTVWHTRTVNLSAYAGQQVYIAIRHYNSDDNYAFIVGSVSVTAGSTPVQQYTITVASNDATMGTVTGGGTYNEGATATLTAIANSGYRFVAWNDGVTTNPRTITVTANATYTATFVSDTTPSSCDVTALPWNYSFITDSISDCWTNIDADGDGLTWMYFQNYGAVSFSYIQSGGNAYSLTPDDWLISPRVTLPASGAEFHYTYLNIAPNYPDHIGVFVSTTNTTPSSFTLLEEYTATAADTVWHTRTVNLSAYAGQQVYIAIRHYNSDDNYAFIVGSVSVTAGGTPVQQYTITALSNDTTMGVVTGGGTYNDGATITLTATPYSGYQFVQWSDGNTNNPRTITVTGNATYMAYFEEEEVDDCVVDVPYYNDFDSNDYNCWGVYDPNQDATSDGLNRWFVFQGIGVNGSNAFGIANVNNTDYMGDYLISPNVTGAGTYVVTWQARTYSPATLYYQVLAPGVDTVGVIDSVADTNYSLHSYTFVLGAGDTTNVVFDYLTIGGSYLLIDNFSITRNGAPTPMQYTITAVSNNAAWGTVTGGGTYNEGATVTLIATPNDGYRFVQWNDGNTNAIRTFTATSNVTLVATFEAIVAQQYTVTASSNNPAWGTVTGGGTYEEGSTVTLTATANAGYRFVRWHDNDTNAVRTITVTANVTYVAIFEAVAVQYYTIAVFANNSAWGTVSGSGTYEEGSTVTLTATANTGYHFVQWNDGDTNAVRTVTVTTNAIYTATFAQDGTEVTFFNVTVLSNNNAWGTVSGGGSYAENSTATITATANTGYHFVEWSDGDTNATRIVTVTTNATYVATFAEDIVVSYNLVVVSNNDNWGTVTGSGSYEEGAVAILTATANPGYHFVEWNDHDTNAVRTVTVTANATYVATFEADAVEVYTVTVLSNNEEWGTVSGSGDYEEGSVAILTATPAVGYHFVEWNDHDTNVVRMVTVTGDATYIATFEANPAPRYTITVLSTNETKGTVSGGGSYEEGEQVTITATPNEGYRFVQWNDGDTNAVRTIIVTGDATYIATFDDRIGIDEVVAINVNLYPNPAANFVTISGVEGQAKVSVVDVNGRTVLVQPLEQSVNITTLDVSSLATGTYFVTVGKAVRKLIIKH